MMYDSHDEIFRQGEMLLKEYETIWEKRFEIREFFGREDYDEIVFLACGSSYWASLSAAMTMSRELGKRCVAVKSGDVVLNQPYYKKCFSRPLVIAPSRSGNTTETLQAVKLFQESYESRVYSIVEYEDAKIKEMADLVVSIPFCNERSVCQTRSFSAMYLGMVLTAGIISENEILLKDLKQYLEDFTVHASEAEEGVKKILESYPEMESMVALGYGMQYGVTVEGAYINIEMAQLPAHYYSLLEWRHGPIVLADDSYLICITCGDQVNRDLEEAMAAETREKKARVLAISDRNDFVQADYQLSLGRPAQPETTALFSVMVMQGFAYYNALRLGVDPDHPAQLVPWISI